MMYPPCSRCGGRLFNEYNDVVCINCGYMARTRLTESERLRSNLEDWLDEEGEPPSTVNPAGELRIRFP